MKYIVVGGNPMNSYTGTVTYTGLNCLASTDDLQLAKVKYLECYDECGGLIDIFDTETGELCNAE